MDNHEQRLTSLEQWRLLIEVSLGKQAVSSEYMKKEFSDLREELQEIKKTAKHLNFTVWGAVIVILIKFALSGQLAAFT